MKENFMTEKIYGSLECLISLDFSQFVPMGKIKYSELLNGLNENLCAEV